MIVPEPSVNPFLHSEENAKGGRSCYENKRVHEDRMVRLVLPAVECQFDLSYEVNNRLLLLLKRTGGTEMRGARMDASHVVGRHVGNDSKEERRYQR